MIQVESPILTGDAPVITDLSIPIPGSNTQVTFENESALLYALIIVLVILVVIVALFLIRRRKTKQENRSVSFIPKTPSKKQDKKRKNVLS